MSDPNPKKVSRMGERQTTQEGLGKIQDNTQLARWQPKIQNFM